MDPIGVFTLFTGHAPDETSTQDTFTLDDGNARHECPTASEPIRIANRVAKTYQVHAAHKTIKYQLTKNPNKFVVSVQLMRNNRKWK